MLEVSIALDGSVTDGRSDPLDRSAVPAALAKVAASGGGREERARRIADIIRTSGAYRWVGLYDVTDAEIAIIAWSGAGPPAYPRFSRTRGLSGAAAATAETVVANDVASDPRYLQTFGDTRAEVIVPVTIDGVVRGTVDVESAVANAFDAAEQAFLEECAAAALVLWS
jgi:putative methionine-R-sulfoxide reductase with GAF domain